MKDWLSQVMDSTDSYSWPDQHALLLRFSQHESQDIYWELGFIKESKNERINMKPVILLNWQHMRLSMPIVESSWFQMLIENTNDSKLAMESLSRFGTRKLTFLLLFSAIRMYKIILSHESHFTSTIFYGSKLQTFPVALFVFSC